MPTVDGIACELESRSRWSLVCLEYLNEMHILETHVFKDRCFPNISYFSEVHSLRDSSQKICSLISCLSTAIRICVLKMNEGKVFLKMFKSFLTPNEQQHNCHPLGRRGLVGTLLEWSM